MKQVWLGNGNAGERVYVSTRKIKYSYPSFASATYTSRQSKAYRDLLDLACVRYDLLHHLHGLSSAALGLLGLTLGLCLDNLYLLTFSNLHSHRCGLQRGTRRG